MSSVLVMISRVTGPIFIDENSIRYVYLFRLQDLDNLSLSRRIHFCFRLICGLHLLATNVREWLDTNVAYRIVGTGEGAIKRLQSCLNSVTNKYTKIIIIQQFRNKIRTLQQHCYISRCAQQLVFDYGVTYKKPILKIFFHFAQP
jgi:hypothetical protein